MQIYAPQVSTVSVEIVRLAVDRALLSTSVPGALAVELAYPIHAYVAAFEIGDDDDDEDQDDQHAMDAAAVGVRFEALCDRLVTLLKGSPHVANVTRDDHALRNLVTEVFVDARNAADAVTARVLAQFEQLLATHAIAAAAPAEMPRTVSAQGAAAAPAEMPRTVSAQGAAAKAFAENSAPSPASRTDAYLVAALAPAVANEQIPANAGPSEPARLRTSPVGKPTIELSDGSRLDVSYELFDASGAQNGDRVRVTRTGHEVLTVLPWLSLAEALKVFVGFGILPADVATSDGDTPWPLALFDIVWEEYEANARNEGIVAFDHDELSVDVLATWLRRSGLQTAKVTEGPRAADGGPSLVIDIGGGPRRAARSVAHEVGPDIHQILEEVDAPWRWYRVHSWDSRAAFVRLNREAAEALGLGLFGAHRGER